MYSQLLVLWWGQTSKTLNIGGKICAEIGKNVRAGAIQTSKGSCATSRVFRIIRGGGIRK